MAVQLQQIDMNLFPVLDAIYATRNLTRAAERLHITQPAVSNALARLRRALDDQLFIRTPSGMSPTPLTENIMPRVQQALTLLGSSVTEHHRFEPASAQKTLRVSMNDMAETLVLPQLLEHLQQVAPGISVESFYVPRDQLAKELAANSLDFALDVPMVSATQLNQQRLVADRYQCMVRPDHPLAGEPSLTLDQYLELEHIHVSSRRSGPGLADIALNKLGRRRKIRLRVQHYRVAPLVVLKTDLALTVPVSLARQYPARCFELPFQIPQMDWHLLWHRSQDEDGAHKWLREQIISLFG
ncbi:LysR family transcriptional regulator [Microbulbifer hydrolyticus]|uniref:DNA-binding transcriptional LysR family regulator n=1 Tax=Microbulbifer hydrolyticus TaxID=48074 RepID=A0A6P1TAS9_9GAMM|nr:LysR family transcriptional regulator [Microbulbifer hydrolyticus]MBB5210797.1 DNA-binding transcriptional LysR family regulator [Microbulbifer hydrolyticus]QHQ38763.1 LysR family transcriptional regulator [Microbulbifer hydrolyticus]